MMNDDFMFGSILLAYAIYIAFLIWIYCPFVHSFFVTAIFIVLVFATIIND